MAADVSQMRHFEAYIVKFFSKDGRYVRDLVPYHKHVGESYHKKANTFHKKIYHLPKKKL